MAEYKFTVLELSLLAVSCDFVLWALLADVREAFFS